jgi:hypothetical protein
VRRNAVLLLSSTGTTSAAPPSAAATNHGKAGRLVTAKSHSSFATISRRAGSGNLVIGWATKRKRGSGPDESVELVDRSRLGRRRSRRLLLGGTSWGGSDPGHLCFALKATTH